MAILFDENGEYTGPEVQQSSTSQKQKDTSGPVPKWAASPRPADKTQGMNAFQLALAGAGADLNEMIQGVKEKAHLAFLPDNYNEAQDVKNRINADRASRREINEALYSDPAAVAGRFAGQAITAAATPARLPAQVAMAAAQGFAKPGAPTVNNIGGELAGSAGHAAADAAAMYGIGKGVDLLGKSAGAVAGKYTDEGAAAMKVKDAAERLGLPPTSIGQLYPHSTAATIERGAPGMGYSRRTYDQAKALSERLDRPLQTPEGSVQDVGRAYVDELANAAKARQTLGADKYRAVDEFVEANGLGSFMPTYTSRAATNINNPGYEVASNLLGRYGFDVGSMAGMKASDLGKIPLSFENFHQMRVAVNKALNTIDRGVATAERMGTSIPVENKSARQYLSDLKTALDSDAESWATKHSGNKDALALYKDATAYYRDVVAPTVLENPIARKAMSGARGFKSGREGLAASQSEAGVPFVARLEPTMTQEGRDLTAVLQGLPDVRRTVLSQDMKVPVPEGGGLFQAGKAALGHPLTAAEMAISRIPGLRAASESRALARLVGSKNLMEGEGILPRVGWGVAQYPEDETERYMRRLSGTK
jgi:hypothetical protein